MLRFISKLPYPLKGQVIGEYDSLSKELRYLMETGQYYWLRDDLDLLDFLLCLSIFYKRVIDPLRGTIEFTDTVSDLGARDVSVGSIRLTIENTKEIKDSIEEFYRIISRFGLDSWILDFSDVRDFLEKMSILKKRDEL